MPDETLFPLLEAQGTDDGKVVPTGLPRIQFAVRNQVEILMTDLDSLIPAEHQVRIVWAFMQGQDLDALYARILPRGSSPERPVIDPRILVALWLNATLDAVGSARELERRCEQDVGYKWLCGGVSVNYHTGVDA